MRALFRISLLGLVMLSLGVFEVSCNQADENEIPESVCGTSIDPDLTRMLVKSTDDLHEFDRVDRAEAVTGPCVLLSRHDPVLEFRFSWDKSATDLMYLATGSGSTSQIAQPRSVHSASKSVIGADGAISQAPCKTKDGNYFTLTLQLPQIKLTDQTHRSDIEKFMRAYFPATLKTLGCA
ncbi:hypothetical protein ACIRU3_01860 [Streptomyces sp. NPDC101151]|uniref:hypothetical protein n=1 Tax=Streptomyces sp. NPDC101151 TaxID=3366115 RepID=UPI00382E32F8